MTSSVGAARDYSTAFSIGLSVAGPPRWFSGALPGLLDGFARVFFACRVSLASSGGDGLVLSVVFPLSTAPLQKSGGAGGGRALAHLWPWDIIILLFGEANRAISRGGICLLLMVVRVEREDC